MIVGSNEREFVLKFGNRLRELRKMKGYSQSTFADAVTCHRTYVGAIERGERNLSIISMYKFAKALDMEVYELLKVEE